MLSRGLQRTQLSFLSDSRVSDYIGLDLMDEVGCYVAFPEVRNVILITTALAVALIYWLAKAVRSRRRGRVVMTDVMATRPTAAGTDRRGQTPSSARRHCRYGLRRRRALFAFVDRW